MKKLSLFVCLFFIAFSSLLLVSCNKTNQIVNVTIDWNQKLHPFIKVINDNSGNPSSWQVLFTDDNDYVQPVLKLNSGVELDKTTLMMVKVGYKIDKIYYLDNNRKEVVLYTYKEGDYPETGESLNGYKFLNFRSDIIQYFTLPNYDITIHIITSSM